MEALTVEDIPVEPASRDELEKTVATDLGLGSDEVSVIPDENAIEVLTESLSPSDVVTGTLEADYDSREIQIRRRVTATTRRRTVETLEDRLDLLNLTGSVETIGDETEGDIRIELDRAKQKPFFAPKI